jgi:hypothetical protein
MSEQQKADGGPAFPVVYPHVNCDGVDRGMTLRDYFAAHAPEASDEWIKEQAERDRLRNPHGDSYKPARRSVMELRAAWRYEYADAMLKERTT